MNLNDALLKYPYTEFSFNYLAGMSSGEFTLWSSYLNFNTEVNLGYILNPTNPSEYVISQRVYPFDVSKFFAGINDSTIQLGLEETNVACVDLSSQYNKLLLFSVDITPPNTLNGCSFINYEPYTDIQLFVPFFGWTDLPVNEVMGKTLTAYLSVDFNTGEGMLILTVTYGQFTRLLLTITNQLGYDIPIGSTNARQVVANYYRQWASLAGTGATMVAGLKGATSTTTKMGSEQVLRKTKGGSNRKYTLEQSETTTTKFNDPSRYVGQATKEVNDVLGGNAIHGSVSRGNSNNVLNNFALSNNAILLIKQANVIWPGNSVYEHLYGYACLTNGCLKDFNTSENQNLLFRFDEIEYTQIPKATQEEMSLIFDALKGGVHL